MAARSGAAGEQAQGENRRGHHYAYLLHLFSFRRGILSFAPRPTLHGVKSSQGFTSTPHSSMSAPKNGLRNGPDICIHRPFLAAPGTARSTIGQLKIFTD
jgi:hypothetical protein